MLKIEACIFDLDGVIANTVIYHYKAWENLAAELGIEFTEAHYERLKGVSRLRSLEIILEIGALTLDNDTKEKLLLKKTASI